MHYETRRSHRMQKYKFGVIVPARFFVESVPVPPEQEKKWFDVLGPRCTGMHYVTHRSHRMQSHKFGVTCPGALFCGIRSGPT
jgi:hypothetical protein